MRTLIDLPEEDVRWLDARASREGRSRAALVRDAVSRYRAQIPAGENTNWIDNAFGIWKHRDDIGDAVEWQRRERASNTRPWDFDYEEVKAEFPDLFDAEDDRQRQLYLEAKRGQ